MTSMQLKLGNLKPSQNLREGRGKPRKPVSRWLIAEPPGRSATSSQQSGKKDMEVP